MPQGSILGPLLFLLFMSDITQRLRFSQCNIYADDVVIYTTSRYVDEASSRLQSDLNDLYIWYTRNKLKINVDKTKVMVLSISKKYDLNICINAERIEQVHSIRYLGIEIDDKLLWNNHVRQLTKQLGCKIYLLQKMRKFVNQNVLNFLYLTLIQPCIDYASSVWGHCSSKSLDNLLRLQKRAARVVKSNYDYVNSYGDDLIKELKWKSFEQRRDYFLATLMYKCVYGLAPTRMVNEIEMVCDRHSHNTRSADSLNVVIPKPNRACFKKCFRFSGAQVWNSLPDTLQNARTVQHFKRVYKQLYFL